MFDNNDLSLGIVQAAQAVTGYYMIGYYTKNSATDGRFRRVKVTLAGDLAADLSYRAGYYGAKDYSEVQRDRQGAPARRRAEARGSDHRHSDGGGGELLPDERSAEYFVPVSVRMPGSELTRPRPARRPRTPRST